MIDDCERVALPQSPSKFADIRQKRKIFSFVQYLCICSFECFIDTPIYFHFIRYLPFKNDMKNW